MKNILLAVICTVFAVLTAKSQDFSKEAPKRKFGAIIYPTSGKIGLKARTGHFLYEINGKIMFSKLDDGHKSSAEFRVSYVLKNSPSARYYLGTGMEFLTMYYNENEWYSDGYLLFVGGVEIFPSVQVPKLSFGMEAMLWNISNLYGGVSVNYYFK